MTNERLTLRDVAQAVLTKHDMSGRQLEALARKRGLTISYTTINAMAAGSYRSTPSDKTLDALVSLSGLAQAEVYSAARRPIPLAPLAERLPEDADSLTGEQQDAVLAVVRQFARANRALQRGREDVGDHVHPAATSQAPVSGAEVHQLRHERADPAAETKSAARKGKVPDNPLEGAGEEHQGDAPDEGA